MCYYNLINNNVGKYNTNYLTLSILSCTMYINSPLLGKYYTALSNEYEKGVYSVRILCFQFSKTKEWSEEEHDGERGKGSIRESTNSGGFVCV